MKYADNNTSDDAEGNGILDERIVVTIEDDCSRPSSNDFDYGLTCSDVTVSNYTPLPEETVTVTSSFPNYSSCWVSGPYGQDSDDGRSCWCEWDFYHPTSGTVDILYWCLDRDFDVEWRVELDGVHVADVTVPEAADCWKRVTIQGVPITEGPHTIFLGTYDMNGNPDYVLDAIKVGELMIEAETYDRMGGNDPDPDWRGVYIVPHWLCPEVMGQLLDGHPAVCGELVWEGGVGQPNVCIDRYHEYPGNTYECCYIEQDGAVSVDVEWTPTDVGMHDVHAVFDPYDRIGEMDEANNIASRYTWVGTPAPYDAPKNRYISFCPNNNGISMAFEVELTASAYYPNSTGVMGWVGEPFEATDEPCVWVARVEDTPFFTENWPAVVHVGDCEIVPVATYQIRATEDGITFGDPREFSTIARPEPPHLWGDVVGFFTGCEWTGPNGVVNMDDVMAAVQKFTKDPRAPQLTWVDVAPEEPDTIMNFTDIQWLVQAFMGEAYLGSDPGECP